ncbi:hypothetical protein E5288_WYG005738 [Bos mutus]|uniref:Uncharacterized protein n=1 Tax=Bos mutus TaxID=72004 RepID=A0A6B0RTZ2_9CETA|nr:hypothetical protein [Bos mutus]
MNGSGSLGTGWQRGYRRHRLLLDAGGVSEPQLRLKGKLSKFQAAGERRSRQVHAPTARCAVQSCGRKEANPTFTVLSEVGGARLGVGKEHPRAPAPAEMSKKRKALEGGGEPQLPEEEPTAWFEGGREEQVDEVNCSSRSDLRTRAERKEDLDTAGLASTSQRRNFSCDEWGTVYLKNQDSLRLWLPGLTPTALCCGLSQLPVPDLLVRPKPHNITLSTEEFSVHTDLEQSRRKRQQKGSAVFLYSFLFVICFGCCAVLCCVFLQDSVSAFWHLLSSWEKSPWDNAKDHLVRKPLEGRTAGAATDVPLTGVCCEAAFGCKVRPESIIPGGKRFVELSSVDGEHKFKWFCSRLAHRVSVYPEDPAQSECTGNVAEGGEDSDWKLKRWLPGEDGTLALPQALAQLGREQRDP